MELEEAKRKTILKDMFGLINRIMDKKTIAQVVDKCYRDAGEKMYRCALRQTEGPWFLLRHTGWYFYIHRRHEDS